MPKGVLVVASPLDGRQHPFLNNSKLVPVVPGWTLRGIHSIGPLWRLNCLRVTSFCSLALRFLRHTVVDITKQHSQVDANSTCVRLAFAFGHPLASTLVELKVVRKSTQVFHCLATQRKSTQVDRKRNLRLFATCESVYKFWFCKLASTCESVWLTLFVGSHACLSL